MTLRFLSEELIHPDCRFFLGDRPCKPHKREGVHCDGCQFYEPITKRIVIIKLGAAGDVIRTTPLLRTFKKTGTHITWITDSPELVPHEWVDRVLKLDTGSLAYLQATSFDVLYNLDKDLHAIALAKLINAKEKFGFTLEKGVCHPVGRAANHKWMTGLFDDLNKANSLSYLEEIFLICGLEFQGEKYILPLDDSPPFDLNLQRPLIGLNTGAGSRWPSRLWALENWMRLADALQMKGYGVLLLGGPEEDSRNQKIALSTGATYLGTFSLQRFIHLLNEVDILVTGVTMALHIGLGLNKRIVLYNNIFNRKEFELYGLGQILEPDVDCLGCFKPVCDRDCMNLLPVDPVVEAVKQEVKNLSR